MVRRRIQPNEVTYTAVMTAYAESRRDNVDRAWDLLTRMVNEGVVPNVMTYNQVFKAMAKRKKHVRSSVDELFGHMLDSGVQPDQGTRAALARVLGADGLRKMYAKHNID